jgi:hypothetical protein
MGAHPAARAGSEAPRWYRPPKPGGGLCCRLISSGLSKVARIARLQYSSDVAGFFLRAAKGEPAPLRGLDRRRNRPICSDRYSAQHARANHDPRQFRLGQYQ